MEENITIENRTTCLLGEKGEYSIPLHIISMFSLLAWSALGVYIPIVAKRFWKSIQQDHHVLLFGKFFGSGVMVGIAFVHILPVAVEALTNECLPEFFTDKYPVFAYFLTMVTALGLHLIEWITVRINLPAELIAPITNKESPTHGYGHAHVHRRREDIDEQTNIKATVSMLTLEAAVAIHSVIIGVALGITTSGFATLWVALTFHQFFEGIGIGFRIADTKTYSNTTVFLTGLFFTLTTPIGIAIGIIVSVTTSATSASSIIAEGVFEAIAAGLLLYSALVSLTAEEFSTNEFHQMDNCKKLVAFIAFYLGTAGISIIGIWA